MYIVIFAIIVAIIVFLYFRKQNTVEGFGVFYDEQKGFADKQIDLYQNVEGKAIYINSDLNIDLLNDALKQPELYLPKSLDRKYDTYFKVDPKNMYEPDDTLCRQAKHPRNLPARTRSSRIGCGWYFVAEPSINSVGAVGRNDGPLYKDSLPPIGEWIWNIDVAAKKEDIKFCKKYKTCNTLHIEEVREKCAFCPSEGHAVPINSDGSQKYPDDPDGSCGHNMISNPDKCDLPAAPEPIFTSDGKSCGELGQPSNDYSIRIYSNDECNKLNGNLTGDGQCLSKKGGSYSWDCRDLNKPSLLTPSPKTICTPNAKGELSTECIIDLATNIGYSRTGGFLRIFAKTAPLVLNDIVFLLMFALTPKCEDYLGFNVFAFMYEKSQKLYISGKAISNFDTTPASVPTLLKRLNLVYTAMSDSDPLISGYSKWLAMGSELPDICHKQPNDKGPFDLLCLKQAFRMAGCQASGEAYPIDEKAFAGKNWSEIKGMFRKLYESMKSNNPEEQDKAVKQCLGINYYRDPKVDTTDDKYTSHVDQDVDPGYNNNIACYSEGERGEFCKQKCDNDPKCKSYVVVKPNTWWGAKSGCCYKNTKDLISRKGITAHIKKGTEGGYLGCFKDSQDRTLTDISIVGRAAPGSTIKPICEKLARSKGHKYYGLQNGEACCSGNDPNYARHGKAENCPTDGGFWTQQIYKLGDEDSSNDYEFIQGMDSGGNDIAYQTGTPEQLKAWCSANPQCKGYNSNGWMKHTIKPRSQWYRYTDNPAQGFFVKRNGGSSEITACGVNAGNQIWCNNTVASPNPTGNWNNLPGSLKHIAINNGKVYGTNINDSIYGADDVKNLNWVQLPGSLKQVSVSDNVVCGVNMYDDIYCNDNQNKNNPNWFQVPGKLKHVTVNKGKLYGANSNNDIYATDNYKNAQWAQVPGKLKQVSFDNNIVCGANSNDEIYCADNNNKQSPNWRQLPGSLKYVSVKDTKLIGVNRLDQIWYAEDYKNPSWKQIPGLLKQVELG